MSPREKSPTWGWRFGGTSRSRFRRQNFMLHGFLAAAPWLNVLVVGVLLALVGSRYLMQRGTVFELPAAPFDEGSLLMTPAALLLPLDDTATEKGALLFFEDLRYHVGRAEELNRFTEALRQSVGGEGRRELILLADEHVPHEWVMAVAHAARKAGLQRVNVAGR